MNQQFPDVVLKKKGDGKMIILTHGNLVSGYYLANVTDDNETPGFWMKKGEEKGFESALYS